MSFVRAAVFGRLKPAMQAEVRAVAGALRRAVGTTGGEVQSELRAQARSAGFKDGGRSIANAWRLNLYPAGGVAPTTFKPAALIWSRMPTVVDAFDRGAQIVARGRKYLAFPTGYNAIGGRRGASRRGGLRITPAQMMQAGRRGEAFVLGRDLTAAERAGLIAGGSILRSIEQAIGRNLSDAERDSLVQGASIERIVEQAIGRDLTADERAGLIQAASVVRTVEQQLGRVLTDAERALVIESAVVTRGINQTIFAPTGTIVVPENEAVLRGIFQEILEATGAALLTEENITRIIRQAVETTETIQISRSIDDKLGSVLGVMRDILWEIRNDTKRVVTATEAFAGRTDAGEGSGANFAFGGVFSGGNIIPFARGGIPDLVGGPTLAPMALFGEAGPEAIMPLRRGSDGRLGVQARTPALDLVPLVAAIERLERAVRQVGALQVSETREGLAVVVDELQQVTAPLRRLAQAG